MTNLDLDLKTVQIMNMVQNVVEDSDVIREILRFLLRLMNLY